MKNIARCCSICRKILLKFIAVSVLFLAACSKIQNTAQEKPNIIFIITDDQQTGLLSIEGNPAVETSNIDRIAKEGVIFTNSFVVTPLCSPSRASILTGQYAHKHGVINNDKLGLDVISHTLMSWPRQLREAGYETAFIGKWHMGLDDSRRPGFDRWFSFKGQGAYVDGVVNDEGTRRQTTGYMTDIINEQAIDYINNDQGSQFTSCAFTGLLEQNNIRISMDGRGRAFDNIFIERLWRTVKYEEVYLHDYQDGIEAYFALDKYFRFYNEERFHSSLGYQTPSEVYYAQGSLMENMLTNRILINN